ncbi:BPM1 [Symbiodinium natans]|uniref:BPM1 protein n=1 Tax=Symbiodinium natans TaxID=878477 RepID=A0A812NJ13_9DINO|nr:BPM1 [Symbiodinium natans]
MLEASSVQVQRNLPAFRLQWLVRMFWAFAKARSGGGPLASLLATQIANERDDFQKHDAQVPTNFIWGLARFATRGAPACAETLYASSRLREPDVQGISNTSWAVATLMWPDVALAAALAARVLLLEGTTSAAVADISRFDPQGLANTAWGTAFSTATVGASLKKLLQPEPQSPANVAWSWATLQMHSKALSCMLMYALLEAVQAHALAVLEEFQPLPLTNLSWSPTGLQWNGEPFAGATGSKARKLMWQYNPQQAANAAWTSSKVSHEDAKLMEAMRE